ncbi:TonB-dependent receptor [Sphingosinicella sp. CPCC 101087]|uniref:TonB-dependent receptor n=1 Tax=Sphingosinicella sp. CPCC 101087 TaxID=2497754 RepID=UPI001FB0DF1B|nr:TonB-dependent receptor [Sphingosinicella sp. CPCC 101087]
MRVRQTCARIPFSGLHLRGALLATAALPLALIASPASAQMAEETRQAQAEPGTGTLETPASDQAAGPDEGEIVVTGIRQTIQTSIARKREETAIVDALSSDEIGDLPALSVGEAIQTITGATTHREKGGATEIAIRGLGPFLSNATFNGREATNGSGDRSVNFNQFPSELINGITIYKTQQANLVEGGVAGTIELETLRPLDFDRRRIQGEIKFNYSPYQDRIVGENGLGWRGTVSYVDQFSVGGLGEIGISLGFQRNDTNNPEETVAGSSTWTACDATIVVADDNCEAITREQGAAGAPYFLVPNSIAWRQITENDRRDAFFGAVQWQPSDRLDINIDLQYSDRTYSEQRNDLNLSEMRYGLTNPVFDENGVLSHVEGLTSIEAVSTLLTRAEEYLGGGFDISWEASDRLTLVADLSYSRTRRSEIERSTRLRSDPLDIYGNPTPLNNQRVPYVYDIGEGFAPTITIDPRFDITNHDLFSDDARIRRDQADRNNEIIAGRIDAIYDLDGGFLSQIDIGARISRLTYDDFDDRVEITQGDRAVDREVNLACRREFQQSSFLTEAPGNSINSWATFDPICLFEGYLGTEDPGRNEDVRSVANRDVEERTIAGYVMGTYESQIGSTPIRGNFGVRVVNTRVTSRGLRSGLEIVNNPDGSISLEETGAFETVTIESESTRILPSLNAIFELQPNVLLRLAGYRAMSRPNPSALGAGRSIDLEDGGEFSSIEDAISQITANGSPRLKPLMSWNADASLEWYPNPDSILAGAVYYKSFTGGFIPVLIDEQFVIDGETITVPVAQTMNSDERSRIWGFELSVSNRFSWLPAPLDSLGVRLSYNYADSNFQNEDIRYGDVFDPETGEISEGFLAPANVSGFSRHVLSAQAYYERGPFSFQAVYNYRSNYYQEFVGGNSQLRYVRGNDTVDLRASVDLTQNVSLRFEAVNLFDEPKITDMPVRGSVRQYHYYGPRYFLGVRLRI